MKVRHFWVGLCLWGISLVVFSMSGAELLHQNLAKIRTFDARFKQEVLSPQGRLKQTLQGRFILQKPGRFVWQVDGAHSQKIISDGRELWVYQEALKQAVRKPAAEALTKTPIQFLSSSSTKWSYYFHIDALKKGNELVFRLQPKDKKIAFQEIQFIFKKNALHQLKFQDALGQRIQVYFSGVRQNIHLSPNLFQFIPPKGVDVLGVAFLKTQQV